MQTDNTSASVAQQKTGLSTIKLRIIAIAATLLVAVLLVCLVVNLVNVGKLNRQRKALQAESARNQAIIERLEEDVLHYTDLETIEKTAREELGMIGSDETLYEGIED